MWYSCVGHRGQKPTGQGWWLFFFVSSGSGRNDFGVFARYHTSAAAAGGVFNPKLVSKCVCVQLARLDPRHAGPTGRWRTEFRVSPPGSFPSKTRKHRKNTPVGDFTLKKTLHSAPSFNWIYIYVRGNQGGRGPTRSYPEDTRIILHPSLFSRREDTKAPDPQS